MVQGVRSTLKEDNAFILFWLAYGASLLKIALALPGAWGALHQKSMLPHRHFVEAAAGILFVVSYTFLAWLICKIRERKRWAYNMYALTFLINIFDFFGRTQAQSLGDIVGSASVFLLKFLAIAAFFSSFYFYHDDAESRKISALFSQRTRSAPIGFFFGFCSLASFYLFPNNKYLVSFLYIGESFCAVVFLLLIFLYVRQKMNRSK